MLGKAKEDKKLRAKINLCVQAMKKLPNCPAAASPTYRIEDGSRYPWQKQFVAGKTFSIKIFWSTGRAQGVAASGMDEPGPDLTITAQGKTGKDVAQMSDAQGEGGGEIHFAPGTKFKTLDLDDSEPKKPGSGDDVVTVYLTVQEV